MDDHHATTMEDINIYQLHPKIRGFTATMGWYQFLSQKTTKVFRSMALSRGNSMDALRLLMKAMVTECCNQKHNKHISNLSNHVKPIIDSTMYMRTFI